MTDKTSQVDVDMDKTSRLHNDDQRKILSIASHASILFTSSIVAIAIPIAIIILSKDDVVVSNAKKALNFLITYTLLTICLLLPIWVISINNFSFISLWLLLLPILLFGSIIMPIIAIIKIARNPNRVYRYPLTPNIIR